MVGLTTTFWDGDDEARLEIGTSDAALHDQLLRLIERVWVARTVEREQHGKERRLQFRHASRLRHQLDTNKAATVAPRTWYYLQRHLPLKWQLWRAHKRVACKSR
jgi:hypothetical protein